MMPLHLCSRQGTNRCEPLYCYQPGKHRGMEMCVSREDLFSGRTLGMGDFSQWSLHASMIDIDLHLRASTCSEV